ncbi:hypothetical protein QQF64_003759 [Cirrhinus molitorella]|uniref:GH18 domain-containing protein n=1 Tax=Cirrhinus molitorella TaxID=172907 RepID=A0ABR3MM92_9TELE
MDMGCYFTNWSQYRPGIGKYTPANVDPFLCTHLLYAFAMINYANELGQLRVWTMRNPHLKTLLAVGGWNFGSSQILLCAIWGHSVTPVEKLRMGFAHTVALSVLSSADISVGAPASGPAAAGTYTREAGFWSYYEVRYLKDQNFGGAFVWALDLDDFAGQFCNQGSYPLMGAFLRQSSGYRIAPLPPTTTSKPDKTNHTNPPQYQHHQSCSGSGIL